MKAYQRKNELGRAMGMTMLFSLLLTVCYLISLFIEQETLYSVFSSLYFVGIDLTLYYLMKFVLAFVKDNGKVSTPKGHSWLRMLAIGYMMFDIAVLLINPFTGIAINYVYRDNIISHFSYQMRPLYMMHLAFDYIIVAAALYHLLRKAFHVPHIYRGPYLRSVAVILAVVAFNALYLYIPGPEGYDYLDYSLAGYSVAGFLLYFLCFENTPRHTELQSWIYENVDQGIVLFDYNDHLVMHNHMAEELLPKDTLAEQMRLDEFAQRCGLRAEDVAGNESRSCQCYFQQGAYSRTLRCDTKVMRQPNGEVVSRLFVFSNLSTQMDVLTGFYNWSYYKQSPMAHMEEPYVVIVCDINGLSKINHQYGHEVGDQSIQRLADAMRSCLPEDACFVRGQEANLIAICTGLTVEEAHTGMEQVAERLKKGGEISVSVQSVVCRQSCEPEVLITIRDGLRSLRTRKLMDQNSNHADTLNSLMQALKECDKDTESHVQRTQAMGTLLAKRMNLSDTDVNNLALLAMLHDIGKIGIPLEILNKPGTLNESEWALMKTHTEKGYQICASSPEFRDIAEMVLHHHERWDGHGYPMGLSKESIPLLSRVIAVVDAYDAMTNDRAYHTRLSIDKARQELIRNAGKQFDPSIVSTFLEVLDGLEHAQDEEAPQAAAEEPEERRWSASVSATVGRMQNVHMVEYCEYMITEDNYIINADKHFERLTGYTCEEVAQLKLKQIDLLPEEDLEGYLKMVSDSLRGKPSAYLEHRLRRKDGQVIYVYCLGTNFFDSSVRKMRTRVVVTNVADSYAFRTTAMLADYQAENRMRRWEDKYRRDPLTGLLNHEAFRNDVQSKLLTGGMRAMMLMVDVDNFKAYNDQYGHLAGDEYLQHVARYLARSIRENDLASRMGGDEFAAVLFFSHDVEESVMADCAQRIFDTINMSLATQNGYPGSVSIGCALTDEGIQSFDQLYEAADQALYRAKNNGRSRMSM